ncbi:MAG: CDP-diacylglycerol--serine O-phosphatidyltransferase [Dichotomicrobium sp.]
MRDTGRKGNGRDGGGNNAGRRPAFLARGARQVPVRALIPNLVTLLALCAGLTAIRMAIDARYELAIGAILLAAVLDALDGRLARMLKSTSRFGAELDSLADFVNFGVAPAVILYVWAFAAVPSLGWLAALIFALCTALRLARFNTELDEVKPRWQANYFTGVPAPAGAIVVLLPFYAAGIGVPEGTVLTGFTFLYTCAMAVLLVSWHPTFSGKLIGRDIDRKYVVPLCAGAALFAAILATYPYLSLLAVSLAYLASIPLAGRRYAAHAAQDDPQMQAPLIGGRADPHPARDEDRPL